MSVRAKGRRIGAMLVLQFFLYARYTFLYFLASSVGKPLRYIRKNNHPFLPSFRAPVDKYMCMCKSFVRKYGG